MATAKRYGQDAKVEGTFRKEHTEVFAEMQVNGIILERQKIAEDCEIIDNRRFIAQPNRVTLDLSLEEAGTLAILAYQTGGHPDGRRGDIQNIGQALRTVGIRPTFSAMRHPDLQQGICFGPTRTETGVSYGLDLPSPNQVGCAKEANPTKIAPPTTGGGCATQQYKEPLYR